MLSREAITQTGQRPMQPKKVAGREEEKNLNKTAFIGENEKVNRVALVYWSCQPRSWLSPLWLSPLEDAQILSPIKV